MAGLHSFCIVFLFLFFLRCCSASYITHHCSHETDHIHNPSFQIALMEVFSELASISSTSKSHRSTTGGVGFGAIQAYFNCWRNIPSQGCKKCVESATKSILRHCLGNQNGTVWNSKCTLHYTTSTEDQDPDNVPWAWWYSLSRTNQIVTSQPQFDDSLTGVMSSLIEKATANSTRTTELFATGEVIVTVLDTLYTMVECSSSETKETCRNCLWAAMARATSCCGGSTAAEVILPSCRLGYDLGPSMSRASLLGPFSASSFSSTAKNSVANAKRK